MLFWRDTRGYGQPTLLVAPARWWYHVGYLFAAHNVGPIVSGAAVGNVVFDGSDANTVFDGCQEWVVDVDALVRFGRELRAARKRVRLAHSQRLTQGAIAFQLGVSEGSYGRWERGLNLPHPAERDALLEMFPELADALRMAENVRIQTSTPPSATGRPSTKRTPALPSHQHAESDLQRVRGAGAKQGSQRRPGTKKSGGQRP